MSVPVSLCGSCGWQGYPLRIWCPACGARELGERHVGAGLVEVGTTLRRAAGRNLDGTVALGTVLLDGGGRAVARLDGVDPGERAALSIMDGALVARRDL